MITKGDVYIQEVYSPPAGEKEVFLFPRAFGGEDYWSYFKQFKLKADRSFAARRVVWVCKYDFIKLFTTKDRFTVYDVVNFLNSQSKERSSLFRALIKKALL